MSGSTGSTDAATLDLSPRPGAASFPRQVAAQAGMEARLMLRNGEQLLLAVVIPVIVLVGGVNGAHHVGFHFSHPAVDVLTPGVLALAVMSTSFTSLAIATGFERRYGVIKRLGSSPAPPLRAAGRQDRRPAVRRGAPDRGDLRGRASLLGWDPAAGGVPLAVLAVVLGTAAFAALGLFVAGVLRAEATLAAANLVYLLLLAGGAVVLPSSSYGAFGHVTPFLPSGALGDAMRQALIDGTTAWRDLGVLLVWAAVGTVLTARTFTVGVSTSGCAASPGPPSSPTSRSSSPAAPCGSPAPGSAARPGRAATAARSRRTATIGPHQLIEFGNRTLTFVLVAHRRGHLRRRAAERTPRPAAAVGGARARRSRPRPCSAASRC